MADTQTPLNAQSTFGTGWAEERFDGRDKYYVPQRFVDTDAQSGINLRNHSAWGKYFPSWFYNQGSWGTCVANASAMCFIYEWNKQGLPSFNPSRLFIYFNARKLAYDVWHTPALNPFNTNRELGSHVRMAFKGLDNFGVPDEKYWDYIEDNFAKDPVAKADTEALKQRTVQYERLDPDNPEEIAFRLKPHERETIGNLTLLRLRQCIAEGHPVVFGFYAYEDFKTSWVQPHPGDDSQGIWSFKALPKDNQVRGPFDGDAVLAIGFDDAKQRILCQNSWGAGPGISWGDGKGVFWLGYDWIRDYEATSDFWMMRLLVNEASAVPTPHPGPHADTGPEPSGRKVTVNFSDNQSGANVNVDVSVNQGEQNVQGLLVNTTVAKQGYLTSIELRGNAAGIVANVEKDGKVLGTAKEGGYVQFGRVELEGVTVDVGGA
ncbi:hypothetical protein PMZ80_010776 [Knufia obscura]|uniref:Peptidase C1A papain C-terminal domain-containing protein n=1 Tax=Knufia obscura TaxID=1635080 RepID=A0ABR0R9T0_9EURO|nr:hypothetical protein PMZ80_010776 [Knufia obscura]